MTAERPAYDRDDPVKVAENADWLAARRQDGFEHVAIDYWRLCRFLYAEEPLAATTIDAHGSSGHAGSMRERIPPRSRLGPA